MNTKCDGYTCDEDTCMFHSLCTHVSMWLKSDVKHAENMSMTAQLGDRSRAWMFWARIQAIPVLTYNMNFFMYVLSIYIT